VKEAQILKTINHGHVIKYFTSFMEDGNLHILMEYADGGDLYELLKVQKKKKKYFSEKDLWTFAYEILLGLEYLHSKNIIHRDIKTLNIFISQQ
jgi:NIMA (never in mitosis gene a)-related kinase 1/4/5